MYQTRREYPFWFDFGFFSGNPYSSVIVWADGTVEIPEVIIFDL